MARMTAWHTRLGLEHPILQAPMAGVQGSALALAVSNAGGLGALPCAMLSPEALQQELTGLKQGTERPWNLNFFCHTPPEFDAARDAVWRAALAPHYTEAGLDIDSVPAGAGRVPFSHAVADALEDFRPPVVSFHFGLPAPDLLARVKSWGSVVLASATTVAEARWLEAHGADAVIAQGLEAGGHRGMFLSEKLHPHAPPLRGSLPPKGADRPWGGPAADDITTQVGTFALVPQIVQAVQLPVIAAGGIADARGVAAVLGLGAVAAQIGTAYLLCPEATTSAVHRAALQSDAAQHTALTRLFSGRPARGIVNRVMQELGAMSDAPPAFPLATSLIAPLRTHWEARGSGDFSPLWAGQNVSGCQAIGAGELTRQLAQGTTPCSS
jgi:nitronate monooxygenase